MNKAPVFRRRERARPRESGAPVYSQGDVQMAATKNVPLLDLKAQYDTIREEIRAKVDEVMDQQAFIMGPEVAAFEEEVAAYCGSGCQAVGVSSGTDALLLAMMALDIGRGDEVITTPFSFFATAGCIVRLGAVPVFVDIEADTFNIDPSRIEAAVTERTKAIIVVHLFGQCAEMDAILEIARRRGLAVIEDAAQAIGAEYRGRRAGSMGDAGCFSFFPSKNLGGFGDGGMVVATAADLAERMKLLRVHGAPSGYIHEQVGGNFRLDALQAAVLRIKLRHLDAWSDGRRANAADYRRRFEAAGLAAGEVIVPVEKQDRHIYNQYVIRVKQRDRLREHLKALSIGHSVYYPLPLHLQPCFADLGGREGDMPVAEKAAGEVLALPVYSELTADQRAYVVEGIRGFLCG